MASLTPFAKYLTEMEQNLGGFSLVYVSIAVGCIAASVLFIFMLRLYKASSRTNDFPPGPPTSPFIGNLAQMPMIKPCLKFREWGIQYGSIIGLKLGPQSMIILNHYKHVRELLDKRGAIYSSRPPSHIGENIVYKNETNLIFMSYGKTCQAVRKAINSAINVSAVDSFIPLQEAEATQTMMEILTKPDGYYDYIRRNASAVVLASFFGQRGKAFDDPRIEGLYAVQQRMEVLLQPSSAPPIDVFPFLKYFPESISWWKREAKACREMHHFIFGGLFNKAKQRLEEGRGNGCFMEDFIRKGYGLDDEHLTYIGGMMMEAGSGTVASTILSFILAMVNHPDILQRAQKEVNDVCGTLRLPRHSDGPSLPYVKAIISEVLRWRPAASSGMPRRSDEDDIYEGYFIPKGTIIFANSWGIHRDESLYERPDEFMPERFLGNKFGTKVPEETMMNDGARVTYVFGAGRRLCQGQYLAENSLLINVARLIWAFNITAPLDPKTGKPVVVDDSLETGYTSGFLMLPERFPCQITPRSSKHGEIIRAEWEKANEFLARYE